MTENEINIEVKKAIGFYLDNTYELSDLSSHIQQIIRDNSDTGTKHILQLERLIFKVQELRENQRLYWCGHKNKLNTCKTQEAELDKKIVYLISTGGYSISRYAKNDNPNTLFK
jgi:hypothetical protein